MSIQMKLNDSMTVSENIAYLLSVISDNSALHVLEQTIQYRLGRRDITEMQAKCFTEECKELRQTESHYNRDRTVTAHSMWIA